MLFLNPVTKEPYPECLQNYLNRQDRYIWVPFINASVGLVWNLDGSRIAGKTGFKFTRKAGWPTTISLALRLPYGRYLTISKTFGYSRFYKTPKKP
jgi:hypothetical protein